MGTDTLSIVSFDEILSSRANGALLDERSTCQIRESDSVIDVYTREDGREDFEGGYGWATDAPCQDSLHTRASPKGKHNRRRNPVSSNQLFCRIPGCPYRWPFSGRYELVRHIGTKHPDTQDANRRPFHQCLICRDRRLYHRKDKLLVHVRKEHNIQDANKAIHTWPLGSLKKLLKYQEDCTHSSLIASDVVRGAIQDIKQQQRYTRGDQCAESYNDEQSTHEISTIKQRRHTKQGAPKALRENSSWYIPSFVLPSGWHGASDAVDGNDGPGQRGRSGGFSINQSSASSSNAGANGQRGCGRGLRNGQHNGNNGKQPPNPKKRKQPESDDSTKVFYCVYCNATEPRWQCRRDSGLQRREFVSQLTPHHKTWHNFEYCTKCLRKFGEGPDEVQPHTLASCTTFRCAIQGCNNYGQLSNQPCPLHRRTNEPHEIWKYLHVLADIQPPGSSSTSPCASYPPNNDFAWKMQYLRGLIRSLWKVVVIQRGSTHRLRTWYNRAMAARTQTPSDVDLTRSSADAEIRLKLQAHEDLAEELMESGANASALSLDVLRERYVATLEEQPPEAIPPATSFASASDQSVHRTSFTDNSSTTQTSTDNASINDLLSDLASENYSMAESSLLTNQGNTSYTLPLNDLAFQNMLSSGSHLQQPAFNPHDFGQPDYKRSHNIVPHVDAVERRLQSMNTTEQPFRQTLQRNEFQSAHLPLRREAHIVPTVQQHDIDSLINYDFMPQ